jgi:hypothetical protein
MTSSASSPIDDATRPSPSYRDFLAIALVALFAVAIRIWPLLTRSGVDWAMKPDDSFEYIQLAHGMRSGCGFARLVNGVCSAPELIRTPGYPLFLSLLPNLRIVLAAQGLIGGLLCLLVAFSVRQRWGLKAALVAEALIAADLPSVVAANQIISEPLFQLILFAAVVAPLWSFSKRCNAREMGAIAVFSGLLLGYAIWTRPIAELLIPLFPIPFVAARWLTVRSRFLLTLVALGLPLAVVIGWAQRNYVVTGNRTFSTISAISVYYYRAAGVLAYHNGTSIEDAQRDLGKLLGIPFEHIFEVKSQSVAPEMSRRGIAIVMRHPLTLAVMTAQSFIYLATVPDRSRLSRLFQLKGEGGSGLGLNAGRPSLQRFATALRQVSQSAVLILLLIAQLALTGFIWIGVALGVVTAFKSWRGGISSDYPVWTLYSLAIAILLMMLAAGAEADVRLRVPSVPLLAMVAALGWFARPKSTHSRALASIPADPPQASVKPFNRSLPASV